MKIAENLGLRAIKAMIDADIAQNTALYPRVQGTPDPNIDFRRVPNLNAFFARHAQKAGQPRARADLGNYL